MKVCDTVRKETLRVALGVLIGDVIMLGVFWGLKKLEYTVLLGTLLGTAAAVGNFFLMGLAVQKAMNDPDHAKRIVQRSYTMRMIVMAAILIVGFVLPYFHRIALVIPFLLPSLTIQAMRLLGLYKPDEEGGNAANES